MNKARRDYDQKTHLDKCLRFRRNRDHELVSSYFVKLHASIQCWKKDGKDIADTFKLVKEFVCYSLVWVAQATMLDKIIYGWEEMNQMKEVFGDVR